jgi:hypothetical protein
VDRIFFKIMFGFNLTESRTCYTTLRIQTSKMRNCWRICRLRFEELVLVVEPSVRQLVEAMASAQTNVAKSLRIFRK